MDIYNKKITICNKLKKADSGVGATTDTWKKTIINGVDIKKKTIRTVSGTSVSLGQSVIVLIPFGKGFLPYSQWKLNPNAGFTVSNGDIVFLEMELSETPTSANITGLKNQYAGVECKVVEIADYNGMAMVQVKIEGV